MVEIIVLSDDEGEPDLPISPTQPPRREASCQTSRQCDVEKQQRPYRIILLDSRRCPRMPRPRFLPVQSAEKSTANLDENVASTAIEGRRSGMDVDDDEEDPDYEDLRPAKRRGTGVKRIPKRHGRLMAPDWEIVENGKVGTRQLQEQDMLPALPMLDRKGARTYVKRLTANVDWEGILRHFEKLKSSEAQGSQRELSQKIMSGTPRRKPNPANQMKQYWQGVLAKSILRMSSDRDGCQNSRF